MPNRLRYIYSSLGANSMSIDSFSARATSILSPSTRFEAVAPVDGADLAGGLTRGLFVSVAGTLVVVDERGVEMSFVSNDAQYHPIRVRRVQAGGTTASGIVALYRSPDAQSCSGRAARRCECHS
jgi:hypothetical protein